MPDVYSREVRSRVMGKIRASNTTPELTVRRVLHRLGYRFRLHRRDLPGSPDIVLPRYRTVVFVHGCFWHQHACKLGKVPKSNQDYWLPKLARNRERDRQNVRLLRGLGWEVITVWECTTFAADRLERYLQQSLPARGAAPCSV